MSGYNRWCVPPAALAIHLSVGEVYAFSVFNLPLVQASGGEWSLADVGWIFSIAIIVLGLSAALFGSWLERVGPRRAMFASAVCFGGGFAVAAAGVHWRQFWLVCLGYGGIGGIGLGLGYIAPVSTLIKWFPDRPGLATGLAIMGFGGGAMIGSALSQLLLDRFRTADSPGVAETFLVLGAGYFLFMMFGVLTVKAAPPALARVSAAPDFTPGEAMRTRSFWLLWLVLLLNVTAGIGVLGQASPMIQEMFPGRVDAPAAAGFVGLLSLANMIGRFLWSSLSDRIGRKTTYMMFFAGGAALYGLTPLAGAAGRLVLFVLGFLAIMTMYGGGFATIPAYLRDQFGASKVGAIHGRLLTAWSVAGVAGPVTVGYLRERQIAAGTAPADAYTLTMHVMAVLLVIGFGCNWLIRPRSGT